MAADDTDRVRARIAREGMILVQDPKLPSLVTTLTGEPVRGSWWGHPEAGRIFRAMERIEDDPDVARFKLIDGKVCLVHRPLFSALACVGRAREPWQMAGLSSFAASVFERVQGGERVEETGPHIKELERRLLCVGDQKHVESGEHATELISWMIFAKERDVSLRRRSTPKAKAELEAIRDRWTERHGRRGKLPWD